MNDDTVSNGNLTILKIFQIFSILKILTISNRPIFKIEKIGYIFKIVKFPLLTVSSFIFHSNLEQESLTMIYRAMVCIMLLFSTAGILAAEDAGTIYEQSCASCHDAGVNRAPT